MGSELQHESAQEPKDVVRGAPYVQCRPTNKQQDAEGDQGVEDPGLLPLRSESRRTSNNRKAIIHYDEPALHQLIAEVKFSRI